MDTLYTEPGCIDDTSIKITNNIDYFKKPKYIYTITIEDVTYLCLDYNKLLIHRPFHANSLKKVSPKPMNYPILQENQKNEYDYPLIVITKHFTYNTPNMDYIQYVFM